MHTEQRFHGLDAARAGALLLGIVLHATMSFFFVVPAVDVSQGTVPAVTFYVIHMFRMTLFFVIAGFFARLVVQRRGLSAFVRDRARRIVVPLVAGWVVLAPILLAVVVWGLRRTFGDSIPGADAAPQGFPLTHLWFLYYLCWLYLGVLGARAVVARMGGRTRWAATAINATFRALVTARLSPFVFALPAALVFFVDRAWAPWFGVTTPDTGLVPQVPAVIAYGTAMAVGWLLHRHVDLLSTLVRHAAVNLALAVLLTVAALSLVGLRPNLATPTVLDGGELSRLLYAAAYAFAAWCWTLGLTGAAVRFCNQPRPVVRYLADASYWLYLAHLPVVFLLQVLLMRVPLHWSIKWPLVMAITMAILLPAYHYLVRGRFLGEFLGGARRGSAGSSVPELQSSVARLEGVQKSYGKTKALENVSMAVQAGEVLAVLGPNGAGKTTAIGLWLGLLRPDAGEVMVMGGSPLNVEHRRQVGVMMQDVALAPALTTREHILLAASYYQSAMSVEDALALTGTTALANTRYGKLSTGQKRQVQFAVAVVGRPRVLFLDEPTVGLDIEARTAMWRTIRCLVDDGCAIVLTTHYLEEAEALANRVVVMAKGRVVAQGTVDEMRALVTRKRISCTSTLAVEEIRQWPGVVEATREDGVVHVTASEAEHVVRQLLAADGELTQLEVKKASLAEAFSEITREAA